MEFTRPLTLADASRLAELAIVNREFMAPYEPPRAEDYYTVAGQEAMVARVLETAERGQTVPRVVLDDGVVVGRMSIGGIVRGPLLSGTVSYWVDGASGGKGLATAALGELVGTAFGELGLHRLEASTLVDNVRSQRVLAHHGFEQFGLAPQFLYIAGEWRDHVLFQLLNPDARVPGAGRGS